ncbi:MAG: hypothetical protein EOR94_27445 [Mesorhizobium sp.]|nr:MAG: hypothetical protein EOR94_27445 [Mesorhizobium sp.]
MFSKKTIFVIGAGASKEVGFPTGGELKTTIRELLRFEQKPNEPLRGDEVLLNSFKRLVEQAHPIDKSPRKAALLNLYGVAGHISEALHVAKSIDNFLHENRGDPFVETVGKLAIARAILDAEGNEIYSKLYVSPSNVHNRLQLGKLEDTWYVPFAQLLLSCTLDELPGQLWKVGFIVFNYDRCLEHFLLWAIRIKFKLDEAEAASLVNEIKIWHPYGRVGRLPWQKGQGVSVQFGSKEADIIEVAKQIRTFTESNDGEGSDIDNLRRELDDANVTIFLGCSYHELNMKLIQPAPSERLNAGKEKRFYGTTFGLSQSSLAAAESRVRNFTTEKASESPYMRFGLDCVGLFNELYAELER